jgi:protein-tyrosine phosphatase
MNNKKLLFIAGKGLSSQIVLNALHKSFGVNAAIFEEKENTKTFLKRRIKKLGYLQVAGQIMFQLVIVPLLRRQAAVVIDAMLHKATLDTTENVDIPDPYYGVEHGFTNVYQLLDNVCEVIAEKLQRQ